MAIVLGIHCNRKENVQALDKGKYLGSFHQLLAYSLQPVVK